MELNLFLIILFGVFLFNIGILNILCPIVYPFPWPFFGIFLMTISICFFTYAHMLEKKKGDRIVIFKSKNFVKISVIVIAYLISVAVADRLWAMDNWAGSTQGAVQAFWLLVFTAIGFMGIMHYTFVKDATETLFLISAPTLLIFAGLEDVLYFLIAGEMIPEELPWLNGGAQSIISRFLGFQEVTNLLLLLNVFFFGTIVIGLYEILKG
jgi:hypothetical protein